MAQYLSRAVFLLSLAFIQSCGGSGGSSSSPAGILFYDLSEDSNGNGYIIENAISPGGQPYTPAPPEISTNGTYPAVFVVDSAASLAFALNSNSSSSSSSFHNGSIESYNTSTAQTTSGIQPVHNTETATNPTDMALDPGGNYLVVADHGSGSGTSTSLTGEVQIFPIGSNGALSSPTIPSGLNNSSCPNPDKIVFPPSGSNGTTTDTFYVVCSSPELINSSPPTPALYSCTISGSCTSIIHLSGLSGSSNAISNMEFASNGTAFLVGETYSSSSSYNGFFLTCQGTPLSCSTPTPIHSPADNAPAGNFAIDNEPTTTAFIGNYSTTNNSSFNNPGIFFSCTSTSCASPYNTYSSPAAGASTYLATGPGQNYLYIVSTTQPLPTTTNNIPSSSSYPGSIFICALPAASSCSQVGTTGSYPYAITFDPSGKFAFVPTWSGTISIFQVASNGTLTADATIPTTTNSSNNLNLQIVVP